MRAIVRGWLEAVLTAIVVLLGMYFVLLGFGTFATLFPRVIKRRLYPASPKELLPDSDSRLEKVIEDTD